MRAGSCLAGLIAAGTPAASALRTASARETLAQAAVGRLIVLSPLRLVPVADALASQFRANHPRVRLRRRQARDRGLRADWNQEHVALLTDTPLSARAVRRYQRQFGFKPAQRRIAAGAVIVIVNERNPIVDIGLDLKALGAIFGGRSGGQSSGYSTWIDVGVERPLGRRPIAPSTAVRSKPTHNFQRLVLEGRDFKAGVAKLQGDPSIVVPDAVRRNENGIGLVDYLTMQRSDAYDGITDVPLRATQTDEPAFALPDTLTDGSYPLTFYLHLYFKPAAGSSEPESPLVQAWLSVVEQPGARAALESEGYVPLPSGVAGA
ncbi:MAG: PstS family phosphate ABC transporter substrate-binding protein [Gammaproteobacteria bacterium]